LVVNHINNTSAVKRDDRQDPECNITTRETKSE